MKAGLDLYQMKGGHRRSHRTGCTGPDPTNFWDSNMGPAQNFVAKYGFTTTWTLPSFQPW